MPTSRATARNESPSTSPVRARIASAAAIRSARSRPPWPCGLRARRPASASPAARGWLLELGSSGLLTDILTPVRIQLLNGCKYTRRDDLRSQTMKRYRDPHTDVVGLTV